MTKRQVRYMVDRFLGWRLPENFNPDAGISFKPNFNEHTPYPMNNEPTGTNLFDATQTEEMVRYLIDGMPSNSGNEEEPYFVEIDNNGCSKCGAGRTWVVVDPDGYAGGTSYGLEEDAQDLAENLNIAFHRGRTGKSDR